MKIFYDFEFYQDGTIIEPISLGAVSESGEEFYVINSSFPSNYWTPWLEENVKPHLYSLVPSNSHILQLSKEKIGHSFYNWLRNFETDFSTQSWSLVGNCVSYDHVCLTQLFGSMTKLPSPMPTWSHDLMQWMDDLNVVTIHIKQELEHNALADARWNLNVYNWLKRNYRHPAWAENNVD